MFASTMIAELESRTEPIRSPVTRCAIAGVIVEKTTKKKSTKEI